MSQHGHAHMHAAVEIVDKTGTGISVADQGVNVVAKGILAAQAFRKYDWLGLLPAKNVSQNLRGIIVCAKARVAYDFVVKYGTKLERFNTYMTVAVALADSLDEVIDIVEANEPSSVKAAKLGAQTTGVAMKVLTGVVTAPVHLILTSMPTQGYCDMADIALGQQVGKCQQTLKLIDTVVESSAKEVSDGNNIYTFVNTTINPRVSKALGL